MNAYVREKVAAALESNGIEEIIKLEMKKTKNKTSLTWTIWRILIKSITKHQNSITSKTVSQSYWRNAKGQSIQGIEFSKKMQAVVDRYNERKDNVYSEKNLKLLLRN